jgi:hypothetical protein
MASLLELVKLLKQPPPLTPLAQRGELPSRPAHVIHDATTFVVLFVAKKWHPHAPLALRPTVEALRPTVERDN